MFLMSQSKILLSATTFKQAQVARYTAAGSRATTLRCMFTVFSSLHADDISNDRTGLKKDSTLHQGWGKGRLLGLEVCAAGEHSPDGLLPVFCCATKPQQLNKVILCKFNSRTVIKLQRYVKESVVYEGNTVLMQLRL